GDHHAVQMAQAAFARDIDEVIDHRCAETDAAELRIEHPSNTSDQPQRTAVTPMQRCVGDDAMSIERQDGKRLRVVDVAAPLLDECAIVDRIPREPPVLCRQAMEEIVERPDVFFSKRPEKNSTAVAQDGLLRIAIHAAEDITAPRSGHSTRSRGLSARHCLIPASESGKTSSRHHSTSDAGRGPTIPSESRLKRFAPEGFRDCALTRM